jgi:hypothetical protein
MPSIPYKAGLTTVKATNQSALAENATLGATMVAHKTWAVRPTPVDKFQDIWLRVITQLKKRQFQRYIPGCGKYPFFGIFNVFAWHANAEYVVLWSPIISQTGFSIDWRAPTAREFAQVLSAHDMTADEPACPCVWLGEGRTDDKGVTWRVCWAVSLRLPTETGLEPNALPAMAATGARY